MAVLMCGFVCALWAAASGRSSGLWFLAGLCFNVFALFAAVYQAGQDRKRAAAAQ
jgi:hypothetical protein